MSCSTVLLVLLAAASATAGPERRVLTLDEAVRTALREHPHVRQARARSAAAGARAEEARSGLLPQVNARVAFQQSTSNFVPQPGILPLPPGALPPPEGSTWNTRTYYNAGATVTQLLWDFGQTPGRWRAFQAAADAERDSERNTESQLVLAVRLAYFSALARRDLVSSAETNLASHDQQLARTERFVAEGKRPRVDLVQARADRARAQVQRVKADNAYRVARVQLASIVGVDEAEFDLAHETLSPVDGEEGAVEPLVAGALAARPDLLALDRSLAAQHLLAGSVRAAYLPTLGISTGFYDGGLAFDQTAWNWSAAVTLSWDVFQGGLTRARAREAQATAEEASAALELSRRAVRLEVTQAHLAVSAAKATLAAAIAAAAAAKERLALAEARYEEGAGTAVDLADAIASAAAADAERIDADYALATARAQLLAVMGQGAR